MTPDVIGKIANMVATNNTGSYQMIKSERDLALDKTCKVFHKALKL
jgi:hypothetical protein